MEYFYYYVSFFFFIAMTVLALVHRHRWLPTIHRYTFLGGVEKDHTFADDVEAGFHSANFDLSANINSGDTRAGLDTKARKAIAKIMRSRKISFDEARLAYVQGNFRRNNIGADGIPSDPRLVTFS